MITANIIGLARLQKRLEAIPPDVREAVQNEMANWADRIVLLMRSLVPHRTGALRNSIGWTWGARPKYAQTIATIRPMKGGLVLTIYVGNSDVRYAHLVEFFTKAHVNKGQFPGTQHPGTPARPFFFVSYRALRKPAGRAIRKAGRDIIRKSRGK
jgi:hypothetical protein